jgi:hypothetical protein
MLKYRRENYTSIEYIILYLFLWIAFPGHNKHIREGIIWLKRFNWFVFKLKTGDLVCEYGVPITKVHEIIPMVAPTRLPQVPDFVEGIINLRGKIIPIIDLKKRFGMNASDITSESGVWLSKLKGRL